MAKRGPQSSLNHLNWNETEEPEEKGEFAKASEDVLKQRIIKKARRRVTTDDADSTATAPSMSVFGGFKGFSSTPLGKSADKPDGVGGGGAQTFSFLSTLGAAKTNGNGTATVSSSAADSGTAKPTFSFGSSVGPLAAPSDAAKKMFTFGSPTPLTADSTEGANKNASSTSSGFGGITSSKEGEKPAPFGFPSVKTGKFSFSPVPPKVTDATKPNSNNFTFGSLAGGNKESSSSDATPKAKFLFGSFAAAKPADGGESEKKSMPTFGSPSPAAPSSTGMFSFASNAAKPDLNSSADKKTGFTFGSPPVALSKGLGEGGAIKSPVSFGSIPAKSDTTETDKQPFTFGSPAGTKEATPSAMNKGMFTFGSGAAKTTASSETPEKPSFTFGAPATATSKTVTSPDPPKVTFSFGSGNATSTKPAADTGGEKKTTFSFGSGAKDTATTTPFSFGAPQQPAPVGTKAPEAEKKTFSFGAPASGTESGKVATFAAPKANSEDAIKQMFSFAATSSSKTAGEKEKKKDEEKKPASDSPKSDEEKQKIIRHNVVALNNAFVEWITKKCRENPYCKLQPVFKDYEKHYAKIEAMKQSSSSESSRSTEKPASETEGSKQAPAKPEDPEAKETPAATKPNFFFGLPLAAKESPTKAPASSGFTFGSAKPFSFGNLASSTSSTTTTPSTVSTTSTSFFAGASTFAAKTSTTPGGFTFGGVTKPAAADSSDAAGGGGGDGEADEDEPPKVEFTPVEEKDSVYSKRCKLFVKTGGSFSDRGVGTLHIKQVDGKVQVLVRADTSLGNILLNIILNESVPLQRLGKNNVMMICLPTPDAKPPPTSVLLRVKTGEEADELHETLQKYKPK
uniref:RanBD1 domain-containing protein n=1 Tax=Anopheles epiroticus TaxID=199890 RepID=A0A182PVT8_9DIPT